MPRSAGCYWTFLQLAKQATHKLASGQQNPCWTVKSWTTLQRCTLHIYALLLVQIQYTLPLLRWGFMFSSQLSSTNLSCLSSGSKTLRGLSIMPKTLKPVQFQLWRYHAQVVCTPSRIIWVCLLDFEKFSLVRVPSNLQNKSIFSHIMQRDWQLSAEGSFRA